MKTPATTGTGAGRDAWRFRLEPGFALEGAEPDRHYRDPSNILRAGGRYHVWFNRYGVEAPGRGYDGSVWQATSRDLRAWTVRGPALGPGPAGRFDAHAVISPYAVRDGDRFYLFYTATAGPFDRHRTWTTLGTAVSDSPDGPWTRLPDPALSRGPPGAWDDFRLDGTSVLRGPDGRWWLYYKGVRNPPPGSRKLGVAWAERPDGPWTKAPGNPVLAHGEDFEGMVFFRRPDGLHMLADRFQSYDLFHFVSPDGLRWRPADPPVALDLRRDLGSEYPFAAPGDYVDEAGRMWMILHGIWPPDPNIRLRLARVEAPGPG